MSPLLRSALALALLRSAAAAAEPPDVVAHQGALTAEALVRAALAGNPQVAAAAGEATAAEARPGLAAALPDPMLEWTFAPLSVGQRDLAFGTTVGLTQRLPFPGKTGLRHRAAAEDARAARRGTAQVTLALAQAARTLHADWYQSARALDVNRAHQALLEELRNSAQAQYGAGSVPQQDVLRAELMLADLAQERLELESRGRVVRLRINALLHRPLDAALPPPPAELEAAPAPADAATLAQRARDGHPALGALDARAAGSTARLALARLGWFPDFEVMASYSTMWAMPQHRLMLGLSVELPVWQTQRRSEVAEAAAMTAALRDARAHLEVELVAAVAEAREKVAEAQALVAGQRARVVPAARATLDSARSAYVTGRAPFGALVEAERELRSAELKLHLSIAELARRRAALEFAVGVLPENALEAP